LGPISNVQVAFSDTVNALGEGVAVAEDGAAAAADAGAVWGAAGTPQPPKTKAAANAAVNFAFLKFGPMASTFFISPFSECFWIDKS
jgi:hypothetical protein